VYPEESEREKHLTIKREYTYIQRESLTTKMGRRNHPPAHSDTNVMTGSHRLLEKDCLWSRKRRGREKYLS
jgi:hypothetical protein